MSFPKSFCSDGALTERFAPTIFPDGSFFWSLIAYHFPLSSASSLRFVFTIFYFRHWRYQLFQVLLLLHFSYSLIVNTVFKSVFAWWSNEGVWKQVNTEYVLTHEKAIFRKKRRNFHIEDLYNLNFSPYLLGLWNTGI